MVHNIDAVESVRRVIVEVDIVSRCSEIVGAVQRAQTLQPPMGTGN